MLIFSIFQAISPMVFNVKEAVQGRLLGRVLRTRDYFVGRHIANCTQFLRASYTAGTFVHLNGLIAQLIALTLSLTVVLIVLLHGSTNKATAAIKLTYAFFLPYFLSLAADMSVLFFSLMPGLFRFFYISIFLKYFVSRLLN